MANTTTGSSPFPTSESSYMSDNGMRSGLESGSTHETVNRLKQSAHETVDRIADKAAPAVDRMRSGMHDVKDSMQARGEQLSAMQEQWLESCRSTVREHPIATVAVAVVAGMLLSKILSSDR
jgi:ElaB/YqjD/DUF883 family membrane-anchored ribosome-binding protein